MKAWKDNPVFENSKAFAVSIINLYKYLVDVKHESVLAKQVLRSGTSIGANLRESINAQSSLDFINKLNIALKEADETLYWLELLYETKYISNDQFLSLNGDCRNLISALTKVIIIKKKQEEEKKKKK